MCITAECPDPTGVGIWWRDDASWKLYSKQSMRAILHALLKGAPSLQLEVPTKASSLPSTIYLIDLSKMEQTNAVSGHKRKIKLVFPAGSDYSDSRCKLFMKDGEVGVRDSVSGYVAPPVVKVARFRLQDSCVLVIRRGNLAKWTVDGEADAVVNPCGAWRRLGADGAEDDQTVIRKLVGADHKTGTVSAALYQAAGPKLRQALQRSVHFGSGRCRSGDAIATPGFELPASHVVHTLATPVYKKQDEASSCAKLEKTYRSALCLAALNGLHYLAFPAISCGAGGFPVELAARVAMEAICSSSGSISGVLEIHIVLLKQKDFMQWMAQASKSFSKLA